MNVRRKTNSDSALGFTADLLITLRTARAGSFSAKENMKAKNVTQDQMRDALAAINCSKYAGNIEFERFDINGKSIEFTLRVKSSQKPGHRLGFTGRRMAKACWHVHGDFFDALLAINKDAVIVTRGGPGAVVTKAGGNWQDCNIGSQMQPMMFSEACECH